MATNGNNPQIEQTEAAMRQLAAGKHPSQIADMPPKEAEATYDLAQRIGDTAKAMRDLADYSNHVAADLERITAGYIANMGRLLGRITK